MSPFKVIAFILVYNIVTIACLDYPKVRRDESIEYNCHGIKVKDPYRWLENQYTEEVDEYLEQQNNFTLNYLSECKQRNEFTKSLDEIANYPQYSKLFKRGTRYFQQTEYPHRLFVRENRESNGRDVFENLQINNTRNDLMNYNLVSRDGESVAFYVDDFNDSDYEGLSLKIFNITSQTLHHDSLRKVEYLREWGQGHGISWDRDSMGFFYISKRESEEIFEESRTYYHQLGTKQEQDVEVVDSSDLNGYKSRVYLQSSTRGDYLILQTLHDLEEDVESKVVLKIFNVQNISTDVRKLEWMDLKLRHFKWKHDAKYEFEMNYVASFGELFYFTRARDYHLTLIEVNLLNSTKENWRTVIDDPMKKIVEVTAVDKDKILVQFVNEDATEKEDDFLVELRFLQNGSLIRTFPNGILGRLNFFGSLEDSEVQFIISDYLKRLPDYTVLNVSDPKSNMEKLFNLTNVTSYDPSQFTAKRTVYLDIYDLQMTIIHKKDMKLDGTASLLIVFDKDVYWRTNRIPVQYGLVHAKEFNTVVAYPDPTEDYKNVIAAAEFLVKHGYGKASRIILVGDSSFGPPGEALSVAVNKRPDLFRALIFQISDRFDMLKMHRQPWHVSTVDQGLAFRQDFEESPLHNIPFNRSGQFPGVFIGTPVTSRLASKRDNEHLEYKYIAELQATVGKSSKQTKPFLLRLVNMTDESESGNDNFVRAFCNLKQQ